MPSYLIHMSDSTTVNRSSREVQRTHRIWAEVNRFFQSPQSAPFTVKSSPSNEYSVSVDASIMVEYLRAHLEFELASEKSNDSSSFIPNELTAWTRDPSAPLRPALLVTANQHGRPTSKPAPDYALRRMLQQLFLTISIAEPGTCDFSICETVGSEPMQFLKLDSQVLNIAFYYAREWSWPLLQPLSFATTWAWVNAGLPYDCDIAKTPSQKALFALLRIAVRNKSVPYDLLIFAEAFEGLLIKSKSEPITKTVRRRLDLLLGAFEDHHVWFNKLYDVRSRIVHGSEAVIRPDEMALDNPEVITMLDKVFGPEWMATAALLGLLQDLVTKNAHSYDLKALDSGHAPDSAQ